MKLTIQTHEPNKDGYELYIDGEYLFSVDEEDYIRLQLYDKSEITVEELNEIKLQIEVRRGIALGLKYALRQRRTSKQVEDFLLKNDISTEGVKRVLQYLDQEKYIDDPDYAKRYIRSKMKTTDKSLNLIVTELDQRGIPEEMTVGLTESYTDMEYDRAYSAVLKRFGSKKLMISVIPEDSDSKGDPFGLEKMTFNEKLKFKNKLVRFLIYRGYQQDIISEIINKAGL